jgi:hypothetical protein
VANEDPEALGCHPTRRGFPACTAEVGYDAGGYAAMFGWIQLVRSSHAVGGGEFEMDPYEPLGSLPHPFCWFGLTPTLFDAPSRPTRSDMDWLAHTFLCFIGDHNEARALLGFSWGFAIADGVISIRGAAPVAAPTWDEHLALLHREHPSWRFASGYHDR